MAGNVEELLIKLTADNKDLKAKMNESQSNLKAFGNAAKSLGAVIGATFAVGTVVAFGKAAFQAAEKQEQANKRLLFALKNNVTAYKSLTDQAEQLRSVTGVDDAAIMQIQQLGANAGYSTDKIKKITEATVNLAAATGQDLQSAYMQINATFNGSAGRLTRLDAEFATLTEEQLKNGAAVDLINQKYEGFATNSATQTQLLASNWDEFTERLGKVTLPAINSFFKELNTKLQIAGDDSLSFWQKLTMPNVVYQDIMRQKKAMENAGKTATQYYRTILGVDAAGKGANALFGMGKGGGAVITPKKAGSGKGKQKGEATEIVADFIPTFEEMGVIAAGAMQGITEVTQTANTSLLTYRDSLGSTASAAEILTNQLKDMENAQQASYVAADMFNMVVAENITSTKDLGIAVWNAARQIIAAKLAETIANSIASVKGIPFPFNLVAAGLAGAGAGAIFNKLVPKLAEGGVASGPTMALVGEYAGAKSNPEVIAPLNKLQSMIGGRQQVEVVGYISGDVIRLANKRSTYISDRRG